uniref:Uncharacterized protein n=1 Tax=Arundo donax TaxID=35708 RepID=A0A0A9BMK9_ARUDO
MGLDKVKSLTSCAKFRI